MLVNGTVQSGWEGLSTDSDCPAELGFKASKLADAIAATGHSEALLERLGVIESERRRIETLLATNSAPNEAMANEWRGLKPWIVEQVASLDDALKQKPEVARAVLHRLVGQLVLTPKQTSECELLEVTGNIHFFTGKSALQVVARDGIEPPTPAFSGL